MKISLLLQKLAESSGKSLDLKEFDRQHPAEGDPVPRNEPWLRCFRMAEMVLKNALISDGYLYDQKSVLDKFDEDKSERMREGLLLDRRYGSWDLTGERSVAALWQPEWSSGGAMLPGRDEFYRVISLLLHRQFHRATLVGMRGSH